MNRQSLDTLLATYPRLRPELEPRQRSSFAEHYRSNRAGEQGLEKIVARLEAWMHRRVAAGISKGDLLEIGAGNLNHVPYLSQNCSYEVVEPFHGLLQDSPYRSRANAIYSDISEISRSAHYDCIFSIAVLEHLTDLPAVLALSGLLLREGGSFRAGFPSEGGLLWGLAWRSTTGIRYRLRYGLDYGNIMRHEHLNTASEIVTLIRYFFAKSKVARFPLPFQNLSFYTAMIAESPLISRCEGYLAEKA